MRAVKYRTRLVDQRAVLEKEVSMNCPDLDRTLNSPEKAVDIAKGFLRLHEETEEYCYMICMNNKLQATGIFELSHGNVNSSIVGIREMYQKALLANAVNVIVLHNHPSGDPRPSREDIEITKRMKDAGDILGVGFIDHIVVGSDSHVSLKVAGYV